MPPEPQPRIYLDNAATSWPKPEAVYRAVDLYQRTLGCSPARSVYAEAIEVDRTVDTCRMAIARLIEAEGPERIVFTFNGTDALNLAIHGLLRPGDHAVTTVADHNSVLRPLRWLAERGRIELTHVPCDAEGVLDPDDFQTALRPNTRLVAMVHASNVTGVLQPVAEVARIARRHGAVFLVDAAQSLGHLPISVRTLDADLLAAPGHKGLLGPLGTGLLYVRPGLERQLETLRQGGTGTRSEEDRQPDSLPDRYESGNLNALGIFGLEAAVGYLHHRGIDHVRRHQIELTARLIAGLQAIPGVKIYGPSSACQRVGVVSIGVDGLSPQDVAAALDSACRVQVRAGLHCARACTAH